MWSSVPSWTHSTSRGRPKADAKSKKTGHADTSVFRELRDPGVTEFTGYRELSTDSVVRGLIVDGDHHPLTWNREDVLLAYAEGMLTGELFNHPMLRVVLFGTLVDEAAYLQRLALKEWARRHGHRHRSLRPARAARRALAPAARPRPDRPPSSSWWPRDSTFRSRSWHFS